MPPEDPDVKVKDEQDVKVDQKALEKDKTLARLMPAFKSSILAIGEKLKVLPDSKEMVNSEKERLGKRLLISKTEQDPKSGHLYLRRLKLMRAMLDAAKNSSDLRKKVKASKKKLSDTYKQNMVIIFDEQRDLERIFRELETFYSEARANPSDTNLDVHIINASFKNNSTELLDPETGLASQIPTKESFDLEHMVGLILIPEWLESEGKIVEVAKIGENSMAHVFVGYRECSLEEAHLEFDEGEPLYNLKSQHRAKQYVTLVGNHLRVRKANAFEDAGGFYTSPAMVLGGKVYKGDLDEGIHVAQANTPHKIMFPSPDNSEFETKWTLREKKHLNTLTGNVVPLVYRKGVVFWGVDTLYDSDGNAQEKMWEQYTVKRCDEYVSKVVLQYLQGITFQPNDDDLKRDIREKIQAFLNANTGERGKMLNFAKVVSVEDKEGSEDELDVLLQLKYKNTVTELHLYMKYDDAGRPESTESA